MACPCVPRWRAGRLTPACHPLASLTACPARHPRRFLRWPAPHVRRKWTQRQRERGSCDPSPSGRAQPSAPGAEVSCPMLSCARPHTCAHCEMQTPPGSATLGWVDPVWAAQGSAVHPRAESRRAHCWPTATSPRGRGGGACLFLRNWKAALGNSGRGARTACFPRALPCSELASLTACVRGLLYGLLFGVTFPATKSSVLQRAWTGRPARLGAGSPHRGAGCWVWAPARVTPQERGLRRHRELFDRETRVE